MAVVSRVDFLSHYGCRQYRGPAHSLFFSTARPLRVHSQGVRGKRRRHGEMGGRTSITDTFEKNSSKTPSNTAAVVVAQSPVKRCRDVHCSHNKEDTQDQTWKGTMLGHSLLLVGCRVAATDGYSCRRCEWRHLHHDQPACNHSTTAYSHKYLATTYSSRKHNDDVSAAAANPPTVHGPAAVRI